MVRRSARSHPTPTRYYYPAVAPALFAQSCYKGGKTPFGSPPGKGQSSPTVNLLWGTLSLAIGYLLVGRAGEFHLHQTCGGLFLPGNLFSARRWPGMGLYSVCRYATRSSSCCWSVIESPSPDIIPRPTTMVCSTNLSLAGNPLGRYCFLNNRLRLGPLLAEEEYALWQAAQSCSKMRRPLTCRAFKPSSPSVFRAGSPHPATRIGSAILTRIVARRLKHPS